MTVTRQVQGWLDVSHSIAPDTYLPDQFPTWILATRNYPLPFFGIPVVDTSTNKRYTKVGIHNHENQIKDPSTNPASVSLEELEEYQRAVKVALNATAWCGTDRTDLLECLKTQSCMYTMTPDDNFIVGIPSEFPNVYAVAGLSGHGFKMAPALGQMLADYALLGEAAVNQKWHPDRFCSPSRFIGQEVEEMTKPTL